LAEIGRIHKTIHILRILDDEEYRRRMDRELNKGEASHELSRFLCFGKEGALRGREFGDQLLGRDRSASARCLGHHPIG
jgi:TnpA family transposase